jgi:argininosuccinate lyase
MICAEMLGREIRFTAAELARVLSPEHFVDVRATPGGPSVAETTRAVAQSRARQAEDERWREQADDALRRAEASLRTAAASL